MRWTTFDSAATMTTLLLTARFGGDDQALWKAAIRRGWTVERLRGSRIPEVADSDVVVYAEVFYAPLIEQALGIRLLDLPDDWPVMLPEAHRQRNISLMSLAEARMLSRPFFAKPPNDKSFEAAVYSSGSELPAEFDSAMSVLVAEPVEWEDEYRCFLLDGQVRAASPYLRRGRLAESEGFIATADELAAASTFAESVAADPNVTLPRAVVLDVGRITGRGWAVVEANGAWGSGIYGCDPDAVLDVIRHAVIRA
jgi:hypothetical protein